MTEVFLFVALRRGTKEADEEHSFGYGKESFVWAFIAALFTFAGGAGISFLKAKRQVAAESRRWNITPRRSLRLTSDTTVKAVYFEDSAALIGLILATAGIALSQLTGSDLWDGLASIAIGLLLLVVATVLARANVSLLVGRAVPRAMHNRIADDLAGIPVVTAVPTLLTMQLGPGAILVAAKVGFHDEVSGGEIEDASDEAERRLRARYPGIRYVFLDPTRGRAGSNHRDGGTDI